MRVDSLSVDTNKLVEEFRAMHFKKTTLNPESNNEEGEIKISKPKVSFQSSQFSITQSWKNLGSISNYRTFELLRSAKY